MVGAGAEAEEVLEADEVAAEEAEAAVTGIVSEAGAADEEEVLVAAGVVEAAEEVVAGVENLEDSKEAKLLLLNHTGMKVSLSPEEKKMR